MFRVESLNSDLGITNMGQLKVTVIFLGILKTYTGEDTVIFEFPEQASYGDLMQHIGQRFHGKLPDEIWDQETESFKDLVMAVGEGRDLQSPDTLLKENEEIKILLVLAGG